MWRVNIFYFCLFYLHVNLYMLVDSVCSFEMFCRQVLRKSRCYVWFYLLNLPVMRYAKSLTNQKSSRGLIPVFPWVNVLFLNIFWEFDRIWPISVASQVMWFHWFFCFFLFFVNEERSHAQSAENFYRKKTPLSIPFFHLMLFILLFIICIAVCLFLYIVYPTLFRWLAYQGHTVNYFFYVF